MAVVHEFNYIRPHTMEEVLMTLAKEKEHAKILAGGTDLAVHIKEGLAFPHIVIDIKHLETLETITVTTDGVMIGAKATFSDIIAHDHIKTHYKMLWDASRTVASMGVRNRATLVGNICSAVPSLDSAPALLCYEAEVKTLSLAGERTIPMHEWFIGPRKTAKTDEEIVLGVYIRKPQQKNAGIYLKLGRYGGEDLAQAGLSILMTEDFTYRLAFCAVGPVPKRAITIEQILLGKPVSPELTKQACSLVDQEVAPITDIRASKEYRTHICKVMVERGLEAVTDLLSGKDVSVTGILGG